MKTAVTHTPGPWTIDAHDDVTQIESAHFTIATNVANVDAPLIAAAPDLLAALKAFVDPWSRGGRNWESKITYETYNRARSIIAKAEGTN